MGLFDTAKQFINDRMADIRRMLDAGKKKAIIAACVLVAYADGSFDPSEMNKIVEAIKRFLPDFSAKDVAKDMSDMKAFFDLGPDFARTQLMAYITPYNGHEIAPILIGICIAVGEADGDFDNDEKAVVRNLCKELGVSPSTFPGLAA